MKELIISAGGVNARLKDFLTKEFNGIPKSILPLPGRKRTLIEEIVYNSRPFFERIQIHANSQNASHFLVLFRQLREVEVVVDNYCTGPIGPQIRYLIERKERVYGCASDFYCDFDWGEFERFHDSHEKPVSIVVAPSISVTDGATFEFNGDTILSWKRAVQTAKNDVINMGCQIIDYVMDFEDVVEQLQCQFFRTLIGKGFLRGYKLSTMGFNINTPAVYRALCDHLR
jgi:NDP-sugar pyrophosphorylase family protein